MKRVFITKFSFLGALLALSIAFPLNAANNGDRYARCTGMVEKNAETALSFAMAWQAENDDPAASHCKALALFKLQRFGEAATLLELLTIQVPDNQTALWSKIVLQSGYARKRMGDYAKAIENYTIALANIEEADIPSVVILLLVERARTNLQQSQLMLAVQDLDHALALDENNKEALLLRARAFQNSGKYEMAKSDLSRLVQIYPDDAEVAKLSQELAAQ